MNKKETTVNCESKSKGQSKRKRRLVTSSSNNCSLSASTRDTAIIMLIFMQQFNGSSAFFAVRGNDLMLNMNSARNQNCGGSNIGAERDGRLAQLLASLSTAHGNSMDLPEPVESMAMPLLNKISRAKHAVADKLKRRNHQAAFDDVQRMLALVQHPLSYQESERLDDLLHFYLIQVLPYDSMFGYRAVMSFYSVATKLAKPFCSLPKRTLLDLLKALTQKNHDNDTIFNKSLSERQISHSDAAYRILERLVTHRGVRTQRRTPLYEADWNRVLGAFCREGRMDRAHQLVALHMKQTSPTISAVTFSILLQGHGQLGQYQQVVRVWQDALENNIVPDIVMVNTLLNAFVDCDKILQARRLFQEIKTCKTGGYFNSPPPTANGRTYNIMLKGLARLGRVDEAMAMGDEMQSAGIWDFVTTNTLIHAAIAGEDYALAETILQKHTVSIFTDRKAHPNVEAYTELLDAYAKSGQLDKAIVTLRVMRQRGVEPTEVTYTCLVAGFGRHGKVEQALQTMHHMSSKGVRPSCILYNALISALVETNVNDGPSETYDARVDQALVVLKSMVQSGVRLNAVTVSTIVAALGRCSTPRVDAAKMLVEQLTNQSLIEPGNSQVVAAMIQTCGAALDIGSALKAFQTLASPDVIAVNAFLDASSRCGKDQLAHQTFEHHFRKGSLHPDVVSYTIIISSLLRKETSSAVANAYSWFNDMKKQGSVVIDTTLVDTILKAIIRIGRSRSLSDKELYFVADVLRDAEQLAWEDGQLQRRKRVVRHVLGDKLRDAWRRGIIPSRKLAPEVASEDELFRRKGWNTVDSRFRVWGSLGQVADGSSDEFLKSKGWNDVNSGFRIL
ncbi:hypothetical protein MPSEU_000636100 [Mayamaea pseudoterrestris]|nr:hypothetical protein MPSEU_000636100 [Mayamaea pseudoterrestris]